MITSSLMVGLISTVVTTIFRLIAVRMKDAKDLREAELRALNAKATVTERARQYENKGFQYTRRFIAIITTICVVALPFLAILWYQWLYPVDVIQGGWMPPIFFGYDVVDKGFWPFTSDTTTTVWKEFKGLVITPWHTEMFAWIMGMYFGNRIGDGRH